MTSASKNVGIKELFEELGKKFLDPNYDSNSKKETRGVKLEQNKERNNKTKKCCWFIIYIIKYLYQENNIFL